jgi:hypothetical protein
VYTSSSSSSAHIALFFLITQPPMRYKTWPPPAVVDTPANFASLLCAADADPS